MHRVIYMSNIIFTIRQATLDDAEELLQLRTLLDKETDFMLLEADERSQDLREQTEKMRSLLIAPNSILLLAKCNNQLIGFIQGRGGQFRRDSRTVDIVVGVLKDFQNKGVGRSLFNALETWAIANQIHRLELTVMSNNIAAIDLYFKTGFKREGIKHESLFVADHFKDEIVMGKILENKAID